MKKSDSGEFSVMLHTFQPLQSSRLNKDTLPMKQFRLLPSSLKTLLGNHHHNQNSMYHMKPGAVQSICRIVQWQSRELSLHLLLK